MPADFGQLCEDVVTATNRPELIGEIQLAVRQATKYFHLRDFFMKDAQENIFTFPVANYTFQISVSDTFTRFRKIRYIKKYDNVNAVIKETPEDKVSQVDPDALFDRYGAPKNNVFYIAGDNLNIRCNTQESSFLISWYAYPDTLPESFKSWIADLYDVAIVEYAKAQIFNAIGMDAEAKRIKDEIETVHWPIIVANDIEARA
jgi:hypothetical protein